MKHYLVGGAVRDKLLNRPVKDRDWVVVGATPKHMLEQGYQSVGADFPVFLHPKTQEEYALARTERKTAKGYNGFECDASQHITLEQDLLRRDLTINAMAMDEHGKIIDPYHGQKDLANKVLRHVSDAFVEDPLRVLRVARFAARYHHLGFSIAPETMALMQTLVEQDELSALSAERVWQETARSILEHNPEVYFEILKTCGALKVWFAELDEVWDTHTAIVLKQAVSLSSQLPIRFACLVHALVPDIQTQQKTGLDKIRQLCLRLKTPNDCRELATMVGQYQHKVAQAVSLTPQAILSLFDHCDIWRKPERFNDFLLACKAISTASNKDNSYPNSDFIWQAYLAANQVAVKAIVEQGYKGKDIREQLNQQRIAAIQSFKLQHTKPS
ncbi:multifunctional CCA addition/repair protein [Paraglaciecola aestuariivivens]